MTIRMSSTTAVLVGIGITALMVFSPMTPPRASAQVKEMGDARAWEAASHEVEGAPPAEREVVERLAARKPEGPVPRTSWDGKPDFNGVYYPHVDIERAQVPLESMYRPEAQALRKKLEPEITPHMYCFPNTSTTAMTRGSHPIAMFHGPGIVVMILEVSGAYRVIPIVDGPPKHNPSVRPSFQGHSVGYWEGDTLVVDVTKFNGKGWLFLRNVSLTSDALHMVERWTRPDNQMIEFQVTVEDPKVLTGPWTTQKMRRGQTIKKDYVDFDPCLEDSKEVALTIEALKIDPAKVKLSRDVMFQGATKFLESEAAKGSK